MSANRICPNCFKKDNIRANFGNNEESERKFHSQKWCDCNYGTPNEMMIDQDMGFTDPDWIKIGKYFLENYHLRINQDRINSKEELLRFFLKLLKNSANNFGKSIELISIKKEFQNESVYDGIPKRKPKSIILENDFFSKVNS